MAVNRAHPARGSLVSRTRLRMTLPCHLEFICSGVPFAKPLESVLKSDSMIMCHWASCQDDRAETDPIGGYSLEPSSNSLSDLQLGSRLLGRERSNKAESD